ncbi:MAG: helix-turn-helix transcriptional regulator [Kibdelosporangium sp.]
MSRTDRLETLSDREREVLFAVALDKTDREVARLLGIRERTVRAHVSRIILKLGVKSRVGAAVLFTERQAFSRERSIRATQPAQGGTFVE